MKAAIVEAAGQTPIYGDFADPVAAPGESRITVTASSLSQLARARASGTHYSSGSVFPFVIGVDGVGRLDDGRRVYFVLPRAPNGAMAEQTVVRDGQWIALPDDIDDATAAVIANPAMSSWAALAERAKTKAGETVLINGATGAAGHLAVKIARHLGAARVIATGRNVAVLESLGADATIALTGDDAALEGAFAAQMGEGIDIVLDYLWGPSARAALIAAAKTQPDGKALRFVQIGSMGGGEIALPAAVLRSTAIEMMGSGLGSVSTERLVASIGGALQVAAKIGLSLDYRAVPLADVAGVWGEKSDARIVFTIGAG